MQQTRQRILDYLGQHGGSSARQLAKAFGMTAANLRRHLGILRSGGMITAVGYRTAESRGRPEQIYALSPASGASLEPLARALLGTLAKSDLGTIQLAKKLLGELRPVTGQVSQRLVTAVRILDPLGYKPRWEARPQGPQMVLGRCPYASIIADHPELCHMDKHLLEELLAVPVEQTAKLQPGPQHTPQCVFILKQVK